MPAASADSVEDRPVLSLGVTVKSYVHRKYQNKLGNETAGTKPNCHTEEQPVLTAWGASGGCAQEPDAEKLQIKLHCRIQHIININAYSVFSVY